MTPRTNNEHLDSTSLLGGTTRLTPRTTAAPFTRLSNATPAASTAASPHQRVSIGSPATATAPNGQGPVHAESASGLHQSHSAETNTAHSSTSVYRPTGTASRHIVPAGNEGGRVLVVGLEAPPSTSGGPGLRLLMAPDGSPQRSPGAPMPSSSPAISPTTRQASPSGLTGWIKSLWN